MCGSPFVPFSGELRDAVKSGDYMAVKLALNSKEDYNLDQEVGFAIHPDLVLIACALFYLLSTFIQCYSLHLGRRASVC